MVRVGVRLTVYAVCSIESLNNCKISTIRHATHRMSAYLRLPMPSRLPGDAAVQHRGGQSQTTVHEEDQQPRDLEVGEV